MTLRIPGRSGEQAVTIPRNESDAISPRPTRSRSARSANDGEVSVEPAGDLKQEPVRQVHLLAEGGEPCPPSLLPPARFPTSRRAT